MFIRLLCGLLVDCSRSHRRLPIRCASVSDALELDNSTRLLCHLHTDRGFRVSTLEEVSPVGKIRRPLLPPRPGAEVIE